MSSSLFPCPNKACEHWNPVGRKTCFSCGDDLTKVNGEKAARAARPKRTPMPMGLVLAFLAGGLALAWLFLGGGDEVTDGAPETAGATSPAEPEPEEVVEEGDLSIASLSPKAGSVLSESGLTVSGEASAELTRAVVNGQPATLDGMAFSADVTLNPGPNALDIEVEDADGNIAKRKLSVTYTKPLPGGLRAAGKTASGRAKYTAGVDGSVMVSIPAGSFKMGSASGDADEKPVHDVSVSAFYMDVEPVTNARYSKFMEATGRAAPSGGLGPLTQPVVNVTFKDATAYAEWAGRSLPTEAQWEYAARGSQSNVYPWGDEVPSGTSGHCNLVGAEDGFDGPSPVGHYPKGISSLGVMDMAGNVWEWTQDYYSASAYAKSAAQDPTGPSSGAGRALRGGAFRSKAADVRAANRWKLPESGKQNNVGFRTVVAAD